MNRYQHLLIFALAIVIPTLTLADCNENQAFNKMMAFNQAWGGYQQKFFALPQAEQGAQFQKFSSGAQRSAEASALLAEKKWNEVCTRYDALSKEYGFDLKAASKGMVTIEELKTDGGKRGGTCTLADASKRYMDMMEKFQDRKANGEISRDVEKAFYKTTEPVGYKIQTDPSGVCQQVAEISKQYQLK